MEKIGSICIFLNRGGLPLKKGPLRIYGLIDVSGSIHYLGQYSPDLKMQMDRCLFFSWDPGYIRHPSHGKDWVHLHFKSGRSTPRVIHGCLI